MQTASRASKQQKWNEIWLHFWQEQMMVVQEATLPMRQSITTPWTTRAHGETTIPADVDEFPKAPSFSSGDVGSKVDQFLAGQGTMLGKTRKARMIKHFKALLLDWFLGYSDMYCPEDTHKLASSYNETFRRALAADNILIQSDLWYAGLVEEMEQVQWQKATAKDHFAQSANADIKAAIEQFLPRALAFAEA